MNGADTGWATWFSLVEGNPPWHWHAWHGRVSAEGRTATRGEAEAEARRALLRIAPSDP